MKNCYQIKTNYVPKLKEAYLLLIKSKAAALELLAYRIKIGHEGSVLLCNPMLETSIPLKVILMIPIKNQLFWSGT